jgi:fatty acid desaturase
MGAAQTRNVHDTAALRLLLRNALPPEAFAPQPWRGRVAAVEVLSMIAIAWAVKSLALPWYGKLAAALVLGQLIVSVSLVLGHENLHHAVFRNHFWRTASSALGVSFFMLTPATWKAWHVQAHHASTNAFGRDPECMPRLEAFHQSRMVRLIHATVPGSRHLASFVSFFVHFTVQGQLFLWYYLDQPGFQHIRIDRARERVKTVLLIAAWIALGVWLGAEVSLFALVIPMLTANFTLLCYIATQHWLCPETPEVNDPLLNTISQSVHPLMDLVHWNFSYHQEHHLFPSMSHGYLPRVREALRWIDPAASVVHPLWRAVIALYRKPALYRDPQTLVRPDGTGALDVSELAPLFLSRPRPTSVAQRG